MSADKDLVKFRFQFKVVGVGQTQSPAVFKSPDQRIRISFEANEICRLEISLNRGPDSNALAARIADAFYERFLFRFVSQIESSSAPRLEGRSSLKLGGSAKHGLLLSVDPADVLPLVERVVMEVEAGQPPFAAALYSARRMYRVALESSDEVVSYLILYTALSLASLFKFGAEQGRDQESLDRWILAEDRLVQTFRRKGKLTPETLYTYLRNQFIHAEDRGADPERAIEEIRANLGSFRKLVAAMLGKL